MLCNMKYNCDLQDRERIGVEKGIAIGIEQGIAIGLEESIAIGREKAKKEIAKKMYGHYNINDIAKLTGLSISAIEELSKEND